VFWLIAVLLILAPVAIVAYVNLAAQPHIYQNVADAPRQPIAIVFGAGLRADGTPSDVLRDRLRVAVDLYKADKVQKLLLTGGGAEPAAMQRFAEAQGVPTTALITDGLGLRTYDSCQNAAALGIKQATLVTQNYHLPRAIYTCRKLGIAAVGVRADLTEHRGQLWFSLREFAATLLAWLDVRTGD